MLNKWFSLIEVIIATSILTISVFWVYKLIWENSKIINNSTNNIQLNYIFPLIYECIDNIIFPSYNIWDNYKINFWTNGNECIIGNNIYKIDNIEYETNISILETWVNYTKWEIIIDNSQSKAMTWTFTQKK